MSRLVEQDIKDILSDKTIDWQSFANKHFLITGGTGLIGQLLCRTLLALDKNIKITLPSRDKSRIRDIYGDNPAITAIEADLDKISLNTDAIDYIIHCAAPTRSKFFIENPVETLNAIVNGTQNLLEIAKQQPNLQKFIYLSSMEMYGVIDGETSETQQGFIDPLDVRSSYSLGKRTAELLCKSYNSEYSIPTINVRLAMCFGPGIPLNDNRVCKYCCDQAIKSEPIILKSSGKTRLNFCYTADAARGIFLLLQKGIDGEAYNLCNNYEQYDIAKMAQTIASFNNSKVIIENSSEKTGFAPDNTMILLNDKIRKLGWKPQNDTEQALRKTYEYIKEENE